MDMVIFVVLFGCFVLGVGAVVALVVWGIVTRHRDHRSAQERWDDEHGNEHPRAPKLYGGPSWTGPGPGF